MPRPLHVYVHFPWCLEKCPYCDFVSFKTEASSIDHEGYADAVIRELEARRGAFEECALGSIFFGGGTPSLWAPRALGRVAAAIRAAFPAIAGASDVEVTAECNPTSLDVDRARALASVGVNRLSVGVQSLDDAQLRFLGRLHDAPLARRAVAAAVEAGVRVSADLIFGLPRQSPSAAAAHVEELVGLSLRHISAYALTVEPGTRFGELARRGRLPLATEDSTCDAFLAIEEVLARHGFEHYEVSNYAVPGDESRHNLGYWRGAPYVGLGCAAYGFGLAPSNGAPLRAAPRHRKDDVIAYRYRNEPDPTRYVAGTRELARASSNECRPTPSSVSSISSIPISSIPKMNDGVTCSYEPLTRDALLRERIMLGLRLAEGVDLEAAAADLGLSEDEVWTPERRRTVDRLSREGGVAVVGARLRVPPARRLATDGIAASLF